jgi:4-hydroxy-tetrahydrodipicolinate reductase
VISAEVIVGMPDQKPTIRHDSGNSARPYAHRAMPAVRKVSMLVGVLRGLDSVLDL